MGNLDKGHAIMTQQITDKILQHEDVRKSKFLDFIAYHMRKNGLGVPRALLYSGDYARKNLTARVDDGRWVVDCPNCNSALMTSSEWSVFVCAECGSPETEGRFYGVAYPKDREKIERLLLLRPAGRGRGVIEGTGISIGGPRFFTESDLISKTDPEVVLLKGQTIDDLIRENEELGV